MPALLVLALLALAGLALMLMLTLMPGSGAWHPGRPSKRCISGLYIGLLLTMMLSLISAHRVSIAASMPTRRP